MFASLATKLNSKVRKYSFIKHFYTGGYQVKLSFSVLLFLKEHEKQIQRKC